MLEKQTDFPVHAVDHLDLEIAKHINELPKRDLITLNIDYKQRGLGGDDSWSMNARPHKEFRLPAIKYNYSYTIEVINLK